VIIVVVPFATQTIDPDASDLARFCTADTAFALDGSGADARLLIDEVSSDALGAAAAALEAEVALGATLKLAEGQVEIDALLVDATGAARGAFHHSLTLGALPQLGRMLARAVLLALGEDAAAPEELVEAEVPFASMLRLARAVRKLQDGAVDEGTQELLALCAEEPPLEAARRSLLSAVRAGQGGAQMPALHAALEHFVEQQPDDAEAVLLLAQSRVLHLEEAGARELFLHARGIATDAALEAQALSGLAALASKAGRYDEAIAHLRASVKLVDEASLYARLGALLLDRDAAEGIAALTRATILAPEDPMLQLALARALREHGGDPQRALNAAAEAARLADSPELLDQIREELRLLLA
jgi:tetratricopeptide (TPR) repeat protein